VVKARANERRDLPSHWLTNELPQTDPPARTAAAAGARRELPSAWLTDDLPPDSEG
jgi:hypothetical protein